MATVHSKARPSQDLSFTHSPALKERTGLFFNFVLEILHIELVNMNIRLNTLLCEPRGGALSFVLRFCLTLLCKNAAWITLSLDLVSCYKSYYSLSSHHWSNIDYNISVLAYEFGLFASIS